MGKLEDNFAQMNKDNITRIAILLGVAMMGLIFIEIYWVKNAVTLRKGQLTRDVNDALSKAILDLLEDRKSRNTDIGKLLKQREQELFGDIELLDKVAEKSGQTWKVQIIEESISDSSGKRKKKKTERRFGKGIQIPINSDPKIAAEYNELMEIQRKANLIADSAFLAGSIAKHLAENGIESPFYFALYDKYQNIVLVSDTAPDTKAILESKFKLKIPNKKNTADEETLAVIFTDVQIYELQSVWVMLTASTILILVLVLTAWYTLYSIVKQKKLSDIRSDFISNMTHEFKTPISTISLACEALLDPEVEVTEEKIFNYLGIIHDENKRLSLLVENVLQTALIEKEGLKLRREAIQVNQFIQKICTNMELSVSKKGGELLTDLKASPDELLSDKVHLANLIFNLIDNALKYSLNEPVIVISTRNQDNGIIISVTDNGIGITKEDKERIFEKFYRVPTGNLHDVKGFGLGLSYVKTITELHNGQIHIISEPGKGSTFEIYLPFEQKTIVQR